MYMDDSIDLIDSFSGVVTSRDGDEDTMKLPRRCLTIYRLSHWVIRLFPLCSVKVLHPAHIMELHRQSWRPPKTTTVPWMSTTRSD